ncbi:hypothetical protein Tco_1090061 [Tanacetum coccineum]|uniref:Uncharacterized protein n=1 Tax=Tanacetum coccineum TaxID=301880 RepID=A0ABQ5I3B3_9ASTR
MFIEATWLLDYPIIAYEQGICDLAWMGWNADIEGHGLGELCTYDKVLSVFPISLAGAASEWFKKDCIGLVTTWENLIEKFSPKFYQLSDNNEEMEVDEDDDPNDIVEIFKIEGNLFDYETPLCKAFNDFNYLLKMDTDLFTFDIQ